MRDEYLQKSSQRSRANPQKRSSLDCREPRQQSHVHSPLKRPNQGDYSPSAKGRRKFPDEVAQGLLSDPLARQRHCDCLRSQRDEKHQAEVVLPLAHAECGLRPFSLGQPRRRGCSPHRTRYQRREIPLRLAARCPAFRTRGGALIDGKQRGARQNDERLSFFKKSLSEWSAVTFLHLL